MTRQCGFPSHVCVSGLRAPACVRGYVRACRCAWIRACVWGHTLEPFLCDIHTNRGLSAFTIQCQCVVKTLLSCVSPCLRINWQFGTVRYFFCYPNLGQILGLIWYLQKEKGEPSRINYGYTFLLSLGPPHHQKCASHTEIRLHNTSIL